MARTKRELTDAQWAKLAPLLPPRRPRSMAPGRRWPAGFIGGVAGVCGTGCWPACRPRPTRAASWTGCCTTWTGRWCGPTRVPPGPAGGRQPPTCRSRARGAVADPDQPGDREALGRSRGGYSTKLHLRVERGGKPMVILATAGQRHEALMLRGLMERGAVKRPGPGRPRIRPDALAGDKGYSYPSLRRYLRRRG